MAVDVCFVLGASDPEMDRIRAIIRGTDNAMFIFAKHHGDLVNPKTAYAADTPVIPRGITEVVAVECAWEKDDLIVHLDHHRPGDHGYGMPPERYLEASSIGQVLAFLGMVPSHLDKLVAASDHCPSYAYRNQCPGVSREEVMAYRLESKAVFQNRSIEAIVRDVTATAETLTRIAKNGIADLRGMAKLPEVPEASLVADVAIINEMVTRDGLHKVNMLGGTPDMIRGFMDGKYQAGLHDVYGDPARGFAGGYL